MSEYLHSINEHPCKKCLIGIPVRKLVSTYHLCHAQCDYKAIMDSREASMELTSNQSFK